MKKFLTFAVFAGTFVPALQSMNTNLPAEVQPVPTELVTLIQNADHEKFKNKFDSLPLTPEQRAALRQVIAETKVAIAKELETMGDNNKNWLEITKGGLVGAYGLSSALLATLVTYLWGAHAITVDVFKGNHEILWLFASPAEYTIDLPVLHLINFIDDAIYDMSKKFFRKLYQSSCITLSSLIAYKTLSYAIKKLKLGFNYKEHLQTMLANLDVIDAHIAQAKA